MKKKTYNTSYKRGVYCQTRTVHWRTALAMSGHIDLLDLLHLATAHKQNGCHIVFPHGT